MQTVLLVDFENVRDVKLAALSADYRVYIFVGRSQNSIPFEITRDAQRFGDRLKWIKIDGDGRNNLDFHLAYYLGRLIADDPNRLFMILSGDRGFDALIKHVGASCMSCARVETLTTAAHSKDSAADPHFDKAFQVLRGIAKSARPRKRKTLTAQVASCFQKKEPAKEIDRVVSLLFAKKLVTEANNALTYNF